MKGMITILKRELAAYFNSTIGYIFIIAFILVNSALFITAFFRVPVAEMRYFFSIIPLIMCVFVPAITMRLWTEDRKTNTLEMLLTFPMNPSSVMLGKFFASLLFFVITVAGTLTIPIMLGVLGNPDVGQIAASYVGVILLGATFLAMGLFISGLCNDQIAAFVITLVACFGAYLLGTNFIASAIDNWLAGFGSLLKTLLGVSPHYESFLLGIIEMADVLYFVAWVVVFLALNCLFIEGRSRSKARPIFAVSVILCVGIGAAFNALVADASVGRFDLTENKVHTVSAATERILSQLKVPAQVNYYVTPSSEMPTEWKTLERDVVDKLKEIRIISGGKIQYKVIHMQAANVLGSSMFETEEEDQEEQSVEERLLDKGIQPFSIRAYEDAGTTTKLVYSSIGIAYKEKKEEIIPQVVKQNLHDLEYYLVSTIFRVSRDEPMKLALYAPLDEVNLSPQMIQFYRQFNQPIPQSRDHYEILERYLRQEKYDVKRVKIDQGEPLPDDYDVLMVVNPRELNERQQWEISRALAEGKKVILAVQTLEWSYRIARNELDATLRNVQPNVNTFLAPIGITVDEEILMDVNSTSMTMSDPSTPLPVSVDLPMHILVTADMMNQDDPVASRLRTLLYLWGTAINMDEEKLRENQLETTVLISSTNHAWNIEYTGKLRASDVEPPTAGTREFPLVVRVKGDFPFAFKDQPRPTWPSSPPQVGMPPPPADEPETDLQKAPGELIIMGCSYMYRNDMFRTAPGNLTLALNCIDSMAYGDDLVSIRGNTPIDRYITMEPEGSGSWWKTAAFWKFVNFALVGLGVAAIGVGRGIARRRSRDRYIEQFYAE